MASRVLSCVATMAVISPPKLSGCDYCRTSYPSLLSSSSIAAAKFTVRIGSVKCKALGESSDRTVYQGIYSPWTVDASDVREVILYRSGLVTAAVSFVVAASAAFLPDDSMLTDIIKQNIDLFYTIGAGGLGLSLFLIHIYVTEIKRTLQALWALGVVGSLATYTSLALPAGENLIQYVINNPSSVWFIGPLFAALTGLVFKEGLCYGKLEAGVLTFIIPTLLLGHLVHGWPFL
ncbi:uncharacterized protein LOC133863731 isoform X2 [Alnus glutinosa]|uniref:uncharacterized protein LOC133863731 isoform X2 n=1 Tax=Alnus glutinosa TaxID=3517 RepID=UPI002D779C94|nr:uncharacterized protein LOC133863731 isoform X2 [Alnus glutinosa]